MWSLAILCTLLLFSVNGQPSSGSEPPASSSAGFLADEIPLEIVITTPTALLRDEQVTVRGQQAITVVFSRPVIALGSDFGLEELPPEMVPFSLEPPVPGRGRWVTTFIYRFDTDGPFATDLRIEFVWNSNLQTYDGVSLTLGRLPTVILKTRSLTMTVNDVRSVMANDATNSVWDPFSGLKSDKLPEVPPDGVVELRFNAPVSLATLRQSLKVVQGKGQSATDLGVLVEPCLSRKRPIDGESKCANVSISGELAIDTRYSFILEQGVDYGKASGPLLKDVMANFGGLRRFRIPFVEFKNPRFSTPFLNMYLPHGLAKGINIQSIPISISDTAGGTISFNLSRRARASLQISADVVPKATYMISVQSSPDIIDAFGLPLAASSIEFKASSVSADFERLESSNFQQYGVFESSQDWSRLALAVSKGRERDSNVCNNRFVIDLWSVTEPASAIPVFRGSSGRSFSRYLGQPSDQLLHETPDEIAHLSTKDITPLLEPTGAVVFQNCEFNRHFGDVFVETTVQATAIAFDQDRPNQRITVWVTSMETGEPVSSATVSFYSSPSDFQNRETTFQSASVTDADGIVHIDELPTSGSLTAVVRIGSKFMYVPEVSSGSIFRNPIRDTIILDRRLVRPGETLHVKGYVKEQSGKQFIPAVGLQDPTLRIFPEQLGTGVVSLTLSPEFGSYEALIVIPEDAQLRQYSINFRARASNRNVFGDSQSFTVGEPRLPTVELTVETPFWVLPTGAIEINVNIESFIGSAVGGSEVKVEWTLNDPSVDLEDETPQGELTITTDDSGNGTGTLDLASLESQPSVGSTVSFDLQLVGPTSELIEKSATVRIEAANVELQLSRTVVTEIPLQPFGVSVKARDLQGKALKGTDKIDTATVSLVKLVEDSDSKTPATSSSPLEGTIVTECEFLFEKNEYCEFALPSTGEFAVEGCVTQGSAIVCQRLFLGQSTKEWQKDPLDVFPPIGFVDITTGKLEIGDEKEILIENPYKDAYAFITWGTEDEVKEKVMALSEGRSIVAVEVDALCEYNCGLGIVVAVPRQTSGLAANITIPVSRLFDPAMPHSETYRVRINGVPTVPTEIPVSVSFPEARMENNMAIVGPGETTSIEVELDTSKRSEITLIAVDKAVLDLLPFALADLAREFNIDLSTSFRFTESSDNILAPELIRELIAYHNSRKELSPWFRLAHSFRDRNLVDQSVEEFIEDESQFITVQGSSDDVSTYYDYYYSASEPAAAPSAAFAAESTVVAAARSSSTAKVATTASISAERAGASAPVVGSTVRLESDFETTPLFNTSVTEDGFLKVDFAAPPNLGTFIIRAYAASVDGVFGSVETEIIVRRELSLTPSVPRFVRAGDLFEAGAVVTVSGSTVSPVSLTADVDGPLEFLGDTVLNVTVGGDGQEEARFTLRALAVGVANFTLQATDEFGSSDALQVEIEIEGLQEAVTVGTSFTIEGNDTQSFVEGIDLPDAIAGSGDILITAGVGRQPAVLALADQILDVQDPFKCPIDGDFGLASVTIPAILNPYNPWVGSAESLGEELADLIDVVLANFEQAVPLIAPGGGLTDEFGLRSFLPCPENDVGRRSASIFQNAQGVFIVDLVAENLRSHSLDSVKNAAATIFEAATLWRQVLGEALETEAMRRRDFRPPLAIDVSTVALARAALGSDWQPNTNNEEIVDDLSMDRLSRSFDDMSIESQAYYILTRLTEPDGINHPDVQNALQFWSDQLRITGRTAYIAAFPGGTSPASDLGNALVFLARLRTGEEGQLLSRIGSYIANPPADVYGFRVFGTYPKLITMQALVEFDVSRGSAQPDLQFDAVSGNDTLLSVAFTNSSARVASSRVLWEDLPAEPEPIEVAAVGSGEASVSITLNFVPADLLPFPTYRGIFVERSIQLKGGEEGDGATLTVVPRSTVVTVKVQFLTPDRLGETIVRVLMPAGLEPVDPNIAGDARSCPVPFFSFFGSFFSRCPLQETRPSVVTFTFDSVQSGTTSVSFRATAATTGKYTLPPTRVFAVNQPEVMGLSSAGTFEVCAGADCVPEFAEPPSPPVNCPNDCNGSGTCNLKEGTCLCFPGFVGEACESIADNGV